MALSIQVTTKGIKVKEIQAMEEYATKKAQRLSKVNDKIIKVDVVLTSNTARAGVAEDYEVVIRVQVPNKTETITEKQHDMYAAIDLAVDRMQEALRRRKEKYFSRKLNRISAFRDKFFNLFRTND